jgi:hypothetical protein
MSQQASSWSVFKRSIKANVPVPLADHDPADESERRKARWREKLPFFAQ